MHYRRCSMWGHGVLTAACVIWLLAVPALAADWPTYHGDSRRSGMAAEGMRLPLEEAWVYEPVSPPSPAWPELPAKQDISHRLPWLNPTVTFDRAFQVAAVGDRVYYGSSADDAVWCLDAVTGKPRWSFVTEGPIRLAPTVAGGRVYAGSDDGSLYCLSAEDGSLVWRYRAGPVDRRLPGNGRMISLFPVRCGIVVEGDSVYFCAGLFPCQGAYLVALNANDGKPLWKQAITASGLRKDLASPQGYLLASASRLFVPTGRTAPHVFGRAAGEALGSVPGGGVDSWAGGSFALLADDLLVHAAGEDSKIQFSRADAAEKVEKIVAAPGLRLLIQGPTAYILTRDRLSAVDRAAYLEFSRLQAKRQRTPQEQQRLTELGGPRKTYLKWDVPCNNHYELILAGETLLAGGDDRVVAYRTTDGKTAWTGPVAGKAYGLAVSGGRLLVSTDSGTIHCFVRRGQARADALPRSTAAAAAAPYVKDEQGARLEQAAEKILASTDARQGYCLVLGAGEGRLAYEIARRSQFQVIVLEADPTKAATARRLLRQTGLYASQISVHCGTLESIRYQPYVANLVTCDAVALRGKLPSAVDVYRVLRPCGGVVAVVLPSDVSGGEGLAKWGAPIPGWKVQQAADGSRLGTVRRGPLPGAGHWSHLYADTANTACSDDRLSQGPVSIQWFGRPGPRHMPDRHDKNTGPVYCDGRLFVSGDDYLVAIDAYNGTILWEREARDTVRLGALKNCGNLAATEDCLYVAGANQCLALDARTGQEKFVVPTSGGKEWGYVAAVDELLLGSETRPHATFRYQTMDTEVLIWRDRMPVVCSESLFAMDRHTGKRLWRYEPAQGVIPNTTIAVGHGRVYFVESTNPGTREVADGRIKLDALLGHGSNLVALDAASGKVLWAKPAGLEQLQHIVFLSYAHEIVLVSGSKNVIIDGKGRVRYDLAAFDAATGEVRWRNTQTPIPDHILQGGHGEQVQHPAIVGDTIYCTGFACLLRTGAPATGWKWRKFGHCGTLSTSAACAFSRYSNGRMFDLKTGEYTDLTTIIRPGCWINTLPAGGLVMIPEFSAGCICGYPLQTSVALLPQSSGQ
ncbi:MAG: PQQ-binding-like beta-propeller repeat protein [Thermoguttaceae bacterium]|jgi:outer membrane protein assembly factor BamB